MFVSYESKSKREIIFWANLTKNSIDKAAYIRENSLYQKNKTDKELLLMEKDIERREKERLLRRGIIK